jgi:hypothetical protein
MKMMSDMAILLFRSGADPTGEADQVSMGKVALQYKEKIKMERHSQATPTA